MIRWQIKPLGTATYLLVGTGTRSTSLPSAMLGTGKAGPRRKRQAERKSARPVRPFEFPQDKQAPLDFSRDMAGQAGASPQGARNR